jgi:hypothetical protein
MANVVRIEEAVRAMLSASVAVGTLVDTRISHGYRLQNTILPAITYEVVSAVQQSLSGGTELWLASVEINVIASSTKEALDVLPALRIACVKGTYGTAVFEAVIWNGHTTSAAVVGEGDEQEPAEVTASIDIYYRD